MKHIGFDQSTVLNEYARIAYEKQIIKTAETPMTRELPPATEPKSIDIDPVEIIPKDKKQEYGRPGALSRAPSVRDIVKVMQEAGSPLLFANLVMGRNVPQNRKVGQAIANSLPVFVGHYAAKSGSLDEYRAHMQFIRTKLLAYFASMMDIDPKFPQNAEAFLKKGFDQYVAQNEEAVPAAIGMYSDDGIESSASLEKGASYTFLNAQNPLMGAANYLNNFWAKIMQGGMADYKKMQPKYTREKNKVIGALMAKFGRNPQFAEAINQLDAEVSKISQPVEASSNVETVKTADQKLYDIAKETGKDLVDAAHPGGGTKTEVSSKTKENLVETIVEQQEADLAVVKKVPKGTYAELVSLYNTLHKMGYKEHLSSLMNSIKLVASEEDILKHALTTLANMLDDKQHYEAADKVDALLKTASLWDWWHDYPDEIGAARQRLEAIDIKKDNQAEITRWKQVLDNLQHVTQSAPPKTQEEIQHRFAQIGGAIKQLQTIQSEFQQASSAGRIHEWGGDDAEYNQSLTAAISGLQKRLYDMRQIQPQELEIVFDTSEEAQRAQEEAMERGLQEAKQQGVAQKKKQNWLHEWWKDPKKVKAIVDRYNKAIEGVDGEEAVSNDVDGAKKALQRVQKYGKDYWNKFEKEMADKKVKDTGASGETATEKMESLREAHKEARQKLSTELAQKARDNIIDWTGIEMTRLSVSARRILNAYIMEAASKIVQKHMPFQNAAPGTSVEERLASSPDMKAGLMGEIKTYVQRRLTPDIIQRLYRQK